MAPPIPRVPRLTLGMTGVLTASPLRAGRDCRGTFARVRRPSPSAFRTRRCTTPVAETRESSQTRRASLLRCVPRSPTTAATTRTHQAPARCHPERESRDLGGLGGATHEARASRHPSPGPSTHARDDSADSFAHCVTIAWFRIRQCTTRVAETRESSQTRRACLLRCVPRSPTTAATTRRHRAPASCHPERESRDLGGLGGATHEARASRHPSPGSLDSRSG
jgi:hypothetical protein